MVHYLLRVLLRSRVGNSVGVGKSGVYSGSVVRRLCSVVGLGPVLGPGERTEKTSPSFVSYFFSFRVSSSFRVSVSSPLFLSPLRSSVSLVPLLVQPDSSGED